MKSVRKREAVITIPVVEIFGPTIQGEGPLVGSRCVFIRFGGCDSDCVWCDTKYSWDPKAEGYGFTRMTVPEIKEQVLSLSPGVRRVVLTGGNPAIHSRIGQLIDAFPYRVNFQVETQGTRFQQWFGKCDWIVISPKLNNAALSKPIEPKHIRDLIRKIRGDAHGPQIALKVVVFTLEDIMEAVAKFYDYDNLRARVDDFTLQVGTRPDDTPNRIIERWKYITESFMYTYKDTITDVRILPQTHVLLWGHGRGF